MDKHTSHWLTVAEAAALADVSKQAIRDAVVAGKIRAEMRPGPSPYQVVDQSDVTQYAQTKRRRQPTQA